MIRFDRRFIRAAAVSALALALGLTLSACGRKGPLDPPPGAQLSDPTGPQPAVDPSGRPATPTGPNKRIGPLDWLLD